MGWKRSCTWSGMPTGRLVTRRLKICNKLSTHPFRLWLPFRLLEHVQETKRSAWSCSSCQKLRRQVRSRRRQLLLTVRDWSRPQISLKHRFHLSLTLAFFSSLMAKIFKVHFENIKSWLSAASQEDKISPDWSNSFSRFQFLTKMMTIEMMEKGI